MDPLSSRIPALRALRTITVLAVGAGLLWLSVGVTFNLTRGRADPELALKFWPWGVDSKLALANRLLQEKGASQTLDRAGKLASEALQREPISAEAARTLALVKASGGNAAAAGGLFHYSESLSRRDMPTQLWLIEEAVQRGDVAGALHHYDRALRTSRSAPDILLPTLVKAADDLAIVAPLNQILSDRPIWWAQFLTWDIRDSSNAAALLQIARNLRLNPSNDEERVLANGVLARLVNNGNFGEALGYYRSLANVKDASLLRDGDFDGSYTMLPFDWWLSSDFNLSATREEADGNEVRLAIRARGGRGGEIARQMLVLEPGRYRLRGIVAGTGQDRLARPMLTVDCVRGRRLWSDVLPAAGENGMAFQFDFTISAGCPAQWLHISAAPAADTDAWIDKLTLQAVPKQ